MFQRGHYQNSYPCYYLSFEGASSSGPSLRKSTEFALLILEVVLTLLVLPSATLVWVLMIQVWILLFWYRPGRSPFARRLDELLTLLLPEANVTKRRLRGSARRWRAQLGAVYAQADQATSETISHSGKVVRGRELVIEAVKALNAELAGGGANVPASEDPVVVLAYGLGAWPSGADLTSLEQLLEELGVTHAELQNRFESMMRTIATTSQRPDFRELAGASFVLGAAARIVHAAVVPSRSIPPPSWLATIKGHLR